MSGWHQSRVISSILECRLLPGNLLMTGTRGLPVPGATARGENTRIDSLQPPAAHAWLVKTPGRISPECPLFDRGRSVDRFAMKSHNGLNWRCLPFKGFCSPGIFLSTSLASTPVFYCPARIAFFRVCPSLDLFVGHKTITMLPYLRIVLFTFSFFFTTWHTVSDMFSTDEFVMLSRHIDKSWGLRDGRQFNWYRIGVRPDVTVHCCISKPDIFAGRQYLFAAAHHMVSCSFL